MRIGRIGEEPESETKTDSDKTKIALRHRNDHFWLSRSPRKRWKFYNPLLLAIGEDNRLSTSKFQFLLWTIVITFAYLIVYSLRASGGHWEAIPMFPESLMWAMGLGGGSAAAAKIIAVNQPMRCAAKKTKVVGPKLRDLYRNDDGRMDLAKLQVVVWTLIAVTIYVFNLVDFIRGHSVAELRLPEIDNSLVYLTGLGHGVYVMNKLADSTLINSSLRQASNSQLNSDQIVEPPTISAGAKEPEFEKFPDPVFATPN